MSAANSLLFLLALSAPPGEGEEMPVAVDGRLKVVLFADAPDVVTPTGIAVDRNGRVLCIESHTHFRPEGYEGPPADRIRRYEDTGGDGRADRITTLFEGTVHTMNLAVYRDGSVYVATRAEVFRLRDTDGDGKADERVQIARLQTPGNYPHNGISGFAFDFTGNVYFGFGENLGADYTLIGSDGVTLAGGGEGGNIYRCKPDGSELTRIATGFWNPFHLCFDAFGRLFAVDNDPDSRPPCRLLHIVPGGDYGYRFRNGRKGLHPFTAWNGELPGTLPMVAGTGEAPSGIVAYESDGLPADYVGTLLVTSWGDHRIDRFRLQPRGASFSAQAEPIVTGGENFRPVGIATAPDGSLYVSDWVDKSYDLHRKGRIWRILAAEPPSAGRATGALLAVRSAHRPLREQAARELAGTEGGRAVLGRLLRESNDARVRAVALDGMLDVGIGASEAWQALHDHSPDVRAQAVRRLPEELVDLKSLVRSDEPIVRYEALRRMDERGDVAALLVALVEDDAFLGQAARTALARVSDVDDWLSWLREMQLSPVQRVSLLLLLRDSGSSDAQAALPGLLKDAGATVRFSAVQWIGEQRLQEYRQHLVDGLETGATTRQLFEAYLTALGQLDGVQRKQTDELGAESYVAEVLQNDQAPPAVRRRALRALRPDYPSLTEERLRGLVASAGLGLQIEAVRTIRAGPLGDSLLAEIAGDEALPTPVRAEAVMGLDGADDRQRRLLLDAALGPDPVLRDEALRSLQGTELNAKEREQIGALKSPAELVERVLSPGLRRRRPPPVDLDAWLALLEGKADPAAGERVFFHRKGPACYRCHEIDGRGGRVGPELSSTARVLSRERLLESILQPSKEIAPQFVPWTIATAEGRVLSGVLVSESATGEQTYADQQGATFVLQRTEIEQRTPARLSIMPEGVERTMTLQEFRDLLAYLQSRR